MQPGEICVNKTTNTKAGFPPPPAELVHSRTHSPSAWCSNLVLLRRRERRAAAQVIIGVAAPLRRRAVEVAVSIRDQTGKGTAPSRNSENDRGLSPCAPLRKPAPAAEPT